MNISEFDALVSEMKVKKQTLSVLDSDAKPTNEIIEAAGKHYGIKFSDRYRDFLLNYGGGYFGFTIVYSLDENSPFYIKNNVDIDFVKERNFLPVIDFETGDTAGFLIHNGICDEEIYIYNHEDDLMIGTKHDLFEVLVRYGLRIR